MRQYLVKVTEKHCDYVLVNADHAEDAKKMAVELAECKYELLHDCKVISVKDTETPD